MDGAMNRAARAVTSPHVRRCDQALRYLSTLTSLDLSWGVSAFHDWAMRPAADLSHPKVRTTRACSTDGAMPSPCALLSCPRLT